MNNKGCFGIGTIGLVLIGVLSSYFSGEKSLQHFGNQRPRSAKQVV